MLDVNNPEIRVDEIMRRIQEKVRVRRSGARTTDVPASAGFDSHLPDTTGMDEVFLRAQRVADAGAAVPAMSKLSGMKRTLAAGVAKAFLRVAQLVTRDQRAFNHAVLDLLRTTADQLARTRSDLEAMRRDLGTFRNELASVRADSSKNADALAKSTDQVARLQTSLSLQERRLMSFLEQGSNAGAVPRPAAEDAPQVLDGTYFAFEEAFRGSRDEIKRRLSVYLPDLRAAQTATNGGPILDVGCGRGELLELLRAEALTASGVDNNRAAVQQCRELGLEAVVADAFDRLSDIPDGSLGAITAIHVVEHLPYPSVLRLIDEALRVLRPGGVAILESPNPQNVLVGSCTFYLDPTHRNPVHPQTLAHLLLVRGMVRIETRPLHPYGPEMHVPDEQSVLARRFNEYFYGPQDYAVLGYRP